MPYDILNMIIIVSDSGLVPISTKPLPETMMTWYQSDSTATNFKEIFLAVFIQGGTFEMLSAECMPFLPCFFLNNTPQQMTATRWDLHNWHMVA